MGRGSEATPVVPAPFHAGAPVAGRKEEEQTRNLSVATCSFGRLRESQLQAWQEIPVGQFLSHSLKNCPTGI
jgi:hypothetical protein